jgi:hypothetical protein
MSEKSRRARHAICYAACMIHRILRNFFRDADNNIAVVHPPNLPLVGWIIFSLLSLLFRHNTLHAGFHSLAQAFLFVWAYLEVRYGRSRFRQLLGAIILAGIILSFFR